MSTKPSGSAIKPLPTVLDVEKSRAERLQRQQARFRDRGGIFVPSNRNILADILLGRAAPRHSPRRSRSRSLSCSPKRHGGKASISAVDKRGPQAHSSTSATRRTPRKAKASINPVSAGPSREGQISAPKKSLASKGKRKGSDPVSNEDTPIKKPRGRPSKKENPQEDDAKPAAKTTSRKGRKTTTTKPSTSQKKGKAKIVEAPDVAECGESDVEPHGESKPKPRTRKSSKPVDSSLKDSTVADSGAKAKAKRKPAGMVHATPTDPPRRTRLKKPIGVYAELSEDDDSFPQPPPKKSSKPTHKSKQPALASDGDPGSQATLPILSQRKAHKKPLSVIEEEADDPYEDNDEPGLKRNGRKDAPPESKKRTFNQTTTNADDTFDANDYSPRKRCKAVARTKLETAGKSSKSASPVEEDTDTSPDPSNISNSHKRAKAIRGKHRPSKADAVVQEKVPKKEANARKVTKRKKTGVQEIVERLSKKPKVDTTCTNRSEAPESELAAHISGEQTKTKKIRNTSKKENILVRDLPKASKSSKVSTEIPFMKGPPKCVLQRIQKAAPRKHDDDNEPDPIDFLS